MSFLEWWGESVDPGTVGTVEFGSEHERCTSRLLVAARLVAVTAILPALWYVAIVRIHWPLWQSAAAVIGGTLIYVALAYLITPQPEMGNIGWCGGLFDHPWRYSDDLNRTLIFLAMVLGPGRFVAESILDAPLLFQQPEAEPTPDAFDGEHNPL